MIFNFPFAIDFSTTIRQPIARFGNEALNLLLDIIKNKDESPEGDFKVGIDYSCINKIEGGYVEYI
jgi:DNA-binding LacI/PurR family transcriptional regulator